MTNRLASALSPYLRQHADNPVDWWPWGEEAFAEAERRHVPVFVSIGYSTCHWCHVMARESFSDPEVAAYLSEHFVSIKVDREEHPDVDASYLAAASAFTDGLGWPLNVFTTPGGRAFYAGTYFPPVPRPGQPSFREILGAVVEAWNERGERVLADSARLAEALADTGRRPVAGEAPPTAEECAAIVALLLRHEDRAHGGLGTQPKFPTTPLLAFLLDSGSADGVAMALRALKSMAASELRDGVEGGFFRYATRADWSVPHYERMLVDNAQLLEVYAEAWRRTGESWARDSAVGLADFLLTVLRTPEGGFASGQDSESTIEGRRDEGGYYARDAAGRAGLEAPAVDAKVLSGANGLAIAALSRAGFVLDRPEWARAASEGARFLAATHVTPQGLARVSLAGRRSPARATLEDYGLLACGLLETALVTGRVEDAVLARSLVDATLAAAAAPEEAFAVPGGPDPVLAARGLAVGSDTSEGSSPSGLSALSRASLLLFALGAGGRYKEAATRAVAATRAAALKNPIAFGATLRVAALLAGPLEQLVVVTPEEPADPAVDARLVGAARASGATVVAVVSAGAAHAFAASGFELFEARGAQHARATAYLCREFACRLPTLDSVELENLERERA